MKKYGASHNKDYSDVVQDIQRGQRPHRLQNLLDAVTNSLAKNIGKSPQEAKEYVHRAFEDVYLAILDGRIKHPAYILHYFWLASRNEYIKEQEKDREVLVELETLNLSIPPPKMEVQAPSPLMKKLYNAVMSLEGRNLEMAWYLLQNPDDPDQEIARALGVSHLNCRVIKSRTLKQLRRLCA